VGPEAVVDDGDGRFHWLDETSAMDIQESKCWLRERGAVKLNLMVRHSNTDALGFGQQLGYQRAEVTVLARWLVDPP
jgi:hypothetical protein